MTVRLALFFAVIGLSQDFEVASVRPSRVTQTGGRGGSGAPCSRGGVNIPQIQTNRFSVTTSLYALISWAYSKNCVDVVANDLLSGGPQWVRSDQFEIQALIPQGTPQYTSKQLDDGDAPELQAMIRALLVDRFRLSVHAEGGEAQGYALTVDRNGVKLRPFKEGSCDSTRGFNPQWLELPREQWPCGTAKIVKRETVASLEGLGIDLAGLANLLTAALDRKPVVDKTGLTSKFDIHLEYADDGNLFTVVQRELGLRLQPVKAATERLTIDRVELPKEN